MILGVAEERKKFLEVGSTMEYSKFHSIPFQVFPVELEWNFPFVCTYVLVRKLYLNTYYHDVRKIVITLFSFLGTGATLCRIYGKSCTIPLCRDVWLVPANSIPIPVEYSRFHISWNWEIPFHIFPLEWKWNRPPLAISAPLSKVPTIF